MSHTPGPWSLTERSERDGVCIDVIAGERAIARGVAASPTHYGETEGSANARLIAAAPDLLKVATDLLGCFADKCECHEAYTSREKNLGYRFKDPNCSFCENEDEILAARSAIAKAEGK